MYGIGSYGACPTGGGSGWNGNGSGYTGYGNITQNFYSPTAWLQNKTW